MKENQIPGQPELFEDLTSPPKPKRFFSPGTEPVPRKETKLAITKELAILGLIIVVILVAAAYSMGIEKGKVVTGGSRRVQETEVALSDIKIKEIDEPPDVSKPEAPREEAAPLVEISEEDNPYTIQVISFKSERLAQEEIDELESQGWKAYTSKPGRYYEVSVGSFANRTEAGPAIEKLRKIYPDCYLKRRD